MLSAYSIVLDPVVWGAVGRPSFLKTHSNDFLQIFTQSCLCIETWTCKSPTKTFTSSCDQKMILCVPAVRSRQPIGGGNHEIQGQNIDLQQNLNRVGLSSTSRRIWQCKKMCLTPTGWLRLSIFGVGVAPADVARHGNKQLGAHEGLQPCTCSDLVLVWPFIDA